VFGYWTSPFRLLGLLMQAAGPLALAYAVLRHRVLDVGVLLRQGLRYAVARRALLALAPLLGVVLVTDLVRHSDQTLAQVFLSRGWLYATLAAVALVAHWQSRAWLPALDRAFFRERYDAHRILRDLLADLREARDVDTAARRAVSQIDAALHPEFTALLECGPHEPSFRVSVSSGLPPASPELRTDGKLLALLRVLGKPVETSPSSTSWLRHELPAEETEELARSRMEWLFPIALGSGRAEGLLALGPKRSEEPYTREDRELVEAVASGLAVLAARTTAAAPTDSRDSTRRVESGRGDRPAGLEHPPVDDRTPVPSRQPRQPESEVLPTIGPGVRLGVYEVVAPLGAGGMGEVFRARDTRLGREVAIRVLRAESMGDKGRRRRFVQEARAASALNHPNIVTIHEIETSAGVDFIVMEYVVGRTLEALIPEHGMTVSEALRVAIPIAAALAAAHEKHIVHRDLKPANIVVSGEGVVKVLDFGVAKLLEDGGDDTGETATLSGTETGRGAIVGTASYMSPEQATGGKVDARTDVFSFGALLYEMVTGHRAFAGKTVSDTLQSVVRDQPPAPREQAPAVPEALERLILLCLRKEPERRFQHMSDVRIQLQEIEDALRARPVVPAGQPTAGRTG
jgi:serine/threonine protein kinase